MPESELQITNLEVIRRARMRAHLYADGKTQHDLADSDDAAIAGYETDCLTDADDNLRPDLWNHDQSVIYQYAFAQQLIALGL